MVLATGPVRETVRRTIQWAALALVLNAAWEAAQLPLYALAGDPDRLRIARYVIHCLAGDVLIATVLFLLAAALWRDAGWPRRRPWRGGAIVVVAGAWHTRRTANGTTSTSPMPGATARSCPPSAASGSRRCCNG